ncbi:MAG: hypothetical protein O3C42_01270 [Bacteroidetes bacterium]|nr:hypothetical protein [Bacteroidota bacterium]
MKKLILILLYLPLIGFGQITVTEVEKNQNNIEFTKNLSYSINSGLGIEIFPEFLLPQHTLLSYYLIPNVNYNISINNELGVYNNVSLPIILRFKSKVTKTKILMAEYTGDPLITADEELEIAQRLIFKLEYNGGVQLEISRQLQARLGIIIPIVIISEKDFQNVVYTHSMVQWGGGLNMQLDYSLSDNLCSSLSISRELLYNPIGDYLKNYDKDYYGNNWITEILIGVSYKL